MGGGVDVDEEAESESRLMMEQGRTRKGRLKLRCEYKGRRYLFHMLMSATIVTAESIFLPLLIFVLVIALSLMLTLMLHRRCQLEKTGLASRSFLHHSPHRRVVVCLCSIDEVDAISVMVCLRSS